MTNTTADLDWGQAIVPATLSSVFAIASIGRHSLALFATPAVPALSIAPQGTNTMLSWPATVANWQLLSATNLTTPVDWQPWLSPLTTNQGRISTPITPSDESRLFRLRSP